MSHKAEAKLSDCTSYDLIVLYERQRHSFMIFLVYREVIPDPDPELKSSSSSGKPDPASSKYKSSVEEGDLAASTAICRGDS